MLGVMCYASSPFEIEELFGCRFTKRLISEFVNTL